MAEERDEEDLKGWIMLHRGMLNNSVVCKDSDHIAVWVYILLKATHKGYQTWFDGEKVNLNPGQLITGRKVIASRTRVSESKVERILKLFESEQQIEQQTSTKNRLITVKSWGRYQSNGQQDGQQVDNDRTTSGQQVDTYNNVSNNGNNAKKDSPLRAYVIPFVEGTPVYNSWLEWEQYRKELKKKLSPSTALKQLKFLGGRGDPEIIAIIDQSIKNGWTGLFDLKNNHNVRTAAKRTSDAIIPGGNAFGSFD